MPDPAMLDKLRENILLSIKSSLNTLMDTDRRFKLWNGSDRRPEMFHYNHAFSCYTSWKGN